MKQKNSIKVSIIVPVYNVEQYLERCLESLTHQTLKDIEIICIDDKSTDDSLKILKQYAKSDSRIKIIALSKNSGVAIARNSGLKVAAGEYLGFVDPDDFVDLDFYKKLYNAGIKSNADIVKGMVVAVLIDGKETQWGPKIPNIQENKMGFNGAWWSAIYKNKLSKEKKINFPIDLTIYEDVVFLVKFAFLSNKIELVDNTYYHYIHRIGSLASQRFCENKYKSAIRGTNYIVDFLNEMMSEHKDKYTFVFNYRFNYLINTIYYKNNTFDARFMMIRAIIDIYNKCIFQTELKNSIPKPFGRLLDNADEIGLFNYMNNRYNVKPMPVKKNQYIKLFNTISMLKIIYDRDTIKIRLFKFIPLLKIRKKPNGNYYRLFNFIPVMCKVIKI